MSFDVGTAERAMRGESLCGDAIRVIVGVGRALFCLADGLGHGPEARRAADAFCEHAEAHANESLESILLGASRALSHTRGCAASLVRVDGDVVELAGVGNVTMRSFGPTADATFTGLASPGIVGRPIRRVLVTRGRLEAGATIVLYSDGVSSRADLEGCAHAACAADVATDILARYGLWHDDASVLVARWRP